MLKKYLTTGILVMAAGSFSLLAHADLQITNNTSQDSTAVINDGDCTTKMLGDLGITKAKSSVTISNFVLYLACHTTPESCKADIYMSRNCGATGSPKVATVLMSTTIGIKSITMFSDEYQMTGGGFSVAMNGGPAFASHNYWWF